jgi:hypothetical protein
MVGNSTQTQINEINGWTTKSQKQIDICLNRLKYNRIINNFYLHDLKKKERKFSWYIILISSFSSALSLANTNSDFFPYSTIMIKTLLVISTLVTTLIGSYIKKLQFVERINNVDRYLQLLNKTVEEINIGAVILEPLKRLHYDDFCKKYVPLIQELSVTPDSLSPTELKKIVYNITRYHEELITVDGSDIEKLWPWYEIKKDNNPRQKTIFSKNIIRNNNDKAIFYHHFHESFKKNHNINNLFNNETKTDLYNQNFKINMDELYKLKMNSLNNHIVEEKNDIIEEKDDIESNKG